MVGFLAQENGLRPDTVIDMKDPRPNIGILIDHECSGGPGNIWVWSDRDRPTKASCGKCGGGIGLVFPGEDGHLVVLEPKKKQSQA